MTEILDFDEYFKRLTNAGNSIGFTVDKKEARKAFDEGVTLEDLVISKK